MSDPPPLSDDEVRVLWAIREGARRPAAIKRPAAAQRNATLAALVARGLVLSTTSGRNVELALAPATAGWAAQLEPPAAAPRGAKTAAPASATLAQKVARLEDELLPAMRRIEAKLDRLLAAGPAPIDSNRTAAAAPAGSRPAASLPQAILDAVQRLDTRHRFGGLVPLPDLRRELGPLGADRPAVDAALLELERDYAIDLNIAQAPATVGDRGAGIERPGRGLLYYVTRRSS